LENSNKSIRLHLDQLKQLKFVPQSVGLFVATIYQPLCLSSFYGGNLVQQHYQHEEFPFKKRILVW